MASDLATARRLLTEADEVAQVAAEVEAAPEAAREQVRAAYVDSREEKVLVQLDGVDVTSLSDVTGERLRLGSVHEAAVDTVGAVVRLGRKGLQTIPGIGPQTAEHLLAAAEQIASAVRSSLRFRIDMEPDNPVATRLLQTLYTLERAQTVAQQHADELRQIRARHRSARAHAVDLAGRWRRLVSWGERRRRAEEALADLAEVIAAAHRTGVLEDAALVARLLDEPMHPIEVWEDYQRRAVTYYTLLESVVPTRRDREATAGRLPADLVRRVEGQPLDTSRLRVTLRGYQEFGARFALAQRRVIIGDDMGLGKTVQALAAAGHLMGDGARHVLVVSPASVLAGWVQQVRSHTDLPVHLLHGDDREVATTRWRSEGGIGICSYAGLAGHAATFGTPDVLIADEAHYVKNPQSNRARAVATLAAQVPHVMFLTGTVMENTLEEFRTLVSYLQPDIASGLDHETAVLAIADARAFRRAVAPVYLRRNTDDVLEELPELVQVPEWVELGAVDGAAYRQAVADGSFMAMRRAAYAVASPSESAKIERIVEIVTEAVSGGRKVVVFSFFREVVDIVMAALGEIAIGPLTGSVSPAARASIVEQFTTAQRGLALVSQIDVGGVGLNLQAASSVILCEPQLKPTTEEQAIARAHRMGQVETVTVHRMLAVKTVDEHLLAILDDKQHLFDTYARTSALAQELAGAVDVSDAEVARRIVEAERTRLVVADVTLSTEDQPVDQSER